MSSLPPNLASGGFNYAIFEKILEHGNVVLKFSSHEYSSSALGNPQKVSDLMVHAKNAWDLRGKGDCVGDVRVYKVRDGGSLCKATAAVLRDLKSEIELGLHVKPVTPGIVLEHVTIEEYGVEYVVIVTPVIPAELIETNKKAADAFDNHCPGVAFLVKTKGVITTHDLSVNNVRDSATFEDLPLFVEEFLAKVFGHMGEDGCRLYSDRVKTFQELEDALRAMGQPEANAKIYSDKCGKLAKRMQEIHKKISERKEDDKKIFDYLTQPEILKHMYYVSALKETTLREVTESDVEGSFVYGLFNFISTTRLRCLVRQRTKIGLLMKVRVDGGNRFDYCSYFFQNDVAIEDSYATILAAEVRSKPTGVDFLRLQAQAACKVRLENLVRGDHSCVLPTIYFWANGASVRFYFEREVAEGVQSEVEFTEFLLNLLELQDRMDLLEFLYRVVATNLYFPPKPKYAHYYTTLLNALDGVEDSFCSKKDTNTSTNASGTGTQASASHGASTSRKKQRCHPMGAEAVPFEVKGYALVSDCYETLGGTLTRISLPSNVHVVRRLGDLTNQEFIAKETRNRSSELRILQLLQTINPPCKNIIELIDNATSNSGPCIIMPKRLQVAPQLSLPGGGILKGNLRRLSTGLMAGVRFLHDNRIVHLDLKPKNLVLTVDFDVQVIDMDVAIQVTHIGELINKFRGTKGHIAPEVGEEDDPQWYDPILADNWSCGRVLDIFAKCIDEGDRGVTEYVAEFAQSLSRIDPLQRRPLEEWTLNPAAPCQDSREGLHPLVPKKRPIDDC